MRLNTVYLMMPRVSGVGDGCSTVSEGNLSLYRDIQLKHRSCFAFFATIYVYYQRERARTSLPPHEVRGHYNLTVLDS